MGRFSHVGTCSITFAVSGCKNVAPPAGAWMTRSGDVIEVGCHSGSKSWSLQCVGGHWIGAVGVCGRIDEGETFRQKPTNVN